MHKPLNNRYAPIVSRLMSVYYKQTVIFCNHVNIAAASDKDIMIVYNPLWLVSTIIILLFLPRFVFLYLVWLKSELTKMNAE